MISDVICIEKSITLLFSVFMLQKVDESFTDTNQLKSTVQKIDVFGTVNELRKDRAGMIQSHETYKLLFQCLQHYGANRIALKKIVPIQISSKSPAGMVNFPSKVTRERKDDTDENDSDMTDEDNEIQYAIEENSDNDDRDHFEEYYEGYFPTTPEYQNIIDMSEYLQ